MLTLRSIAAVVTVAALSACGSEAHQTIAAPATGADVKFFNFGVGAPSVNFYGNDAKLTAIASSTGAESLLGTAYGSAGNAGYYSAIVPGQYTFSSRITATTDNGLPIASAPAAVVDGKFYSMYVSGFYNTTTKQADAFVIEDVFPSTIDFTVANVLRQEHRHGCRGSGGGPGGVQVGRRLREPADWRVRPQHPHGGIVGERHRPHGSLLLRRTGLHRRRPRRHHHRRYHGGRPGTAGQYDESVGASGAVP
jgi:hypothetical protein